jgi:hypothetical protein
MYYFQLNINVLQTGLWFDGALWWEGSQELYPIAFKKYNL